MVRVDTDLVNTVFTAVDRDRHFVTTLRADDVRIFENETPQESAFSSAKLTDHSYWLFWLIPANPRKELSLTKRRAAKAFIKSVVRPEKDKVGVVSFTGKPTVEQTLTDQIAKLNRSIDRLKVELPGDNPYCEAVKSVQEDPLCWTSIWDSVWASTNEILAQTPENSRRAIILLSDGDDTSSTIKRQDAIESALKNNVIIYSIGIGDLGVLQNRSRFSAEAF